MIEKLVSFWQILKTSYSLTNFNPIIEAMRVVTKKIRQKVAGSLKKKIPIKTLPTAPIPVQIAYAVPIGNPFSPEIALYIRNIERNKHTKKPNHQ